MFFGDGPLGIPGEGTEENPIILHGCTSSEFAHFLGWLDLRCVDCLLSISDFVLNFNKAMVFPDEQ